MGLLEPHDELGLPWDDWADGQAHLLTRGVDFFRSSDVLVEAAKNAGRRLNRAVTVVKEQRLGRTHVWVQFPEYEILLGESCPCGSQELRRLNQQHAECAACGATLILRVPKKRTVADEEMPAGSGPADELLAPLFALPARASAGGKGAPVLSSGGAA